MGKYLIVGDVDHIQDYVFGSSRLRAIRGASALLDRISEEISSSLGKLPCCDVLRWLGGQIVVICEDGTAEVCAEIERRFKRGSEGEVNITTSCEPYKDGDFKCAIERAFRKVKAEKAGRQNTQGHGEAFLTSSYDRRCSMLPSQSAFAIRRAGDDSRYLSRTALARWRSVKNIPSDSNLIYKLHEKGIATDRLPYSPEDLWKRESDGQIYGFYYG